MDWLIWDRVGRVVGTGVGIGNTSSRLHVARTFYDGEGEGCDRS